MAHFDAVLPGRVHRVIYERTVEDTEAEVRKLLDYCGLPFEPGCLRFFENDRPVRTASAEQVRQPIYRDGVEQWRHYEAWLGPLKEASGSGARCVPRRPDRLRPGGCAELVHQRLLLTRNGAGTVWLCCGERCSLNTTG
jgi:hypothetical protein